MNRVKNLLLGLAAVSAVAGGAITVTSFASATATAAMAKMA